MNLGEFAEYVQGISKEEFVSRFPGPFLLFGGPAVPPRKQAVRSLAGAYDSRPPDRVPVGSDRSHALCIERPGISPQHGLFREKPQPPNQGWYLYDTNSAQGVRLNGLRLLPQQPYLVGSGDTLQFGSEVKATFFEAERIHDLMCAFETQLEFKAFDLSLLDDGEVTKTGVGLAIVPPPAPVARPQGFNRESPSDLVKSETTHWVHCPPMRPLPLKDGESFTIGRQEDTDLCLQHPLVSRAHARLSLLEGGVWIEDLGSTNGTLVGSFKIPPEGRSPVSLDQVVTIGPFHLQVNRDKAILQARISDMGKKTTQSLVAGGDLSEEHAFSGNLSEFPLLELLRFMEAQSKTGTLRVEDMLSEARLIFSSGRPVYAENGDLKGMAALESILDLDSGHFAFLTKIDFPKQSNLDITISDLLREYT